MEDPALGEAFLLLQSIPGIKEESAASILFSTSAQLSSWVGLCPLLPTELAELYPASPKYVALRRCVTLWITLPMGWGWRPKTRS